MYKMDKFARVLKRNIEIEFGIEVEMFFSNRKQLHIGFQQPVTSYNFFNNILNFIQLVWKHHSVLGYELVFAIPSLQRPKYTKFYNIFFRRNQK